jgi:Flp pilus assembly protein TadG
MSLAISNKRGTTMAFVALSMTALLSIVALAVDVGMLFNTRSEAQRAADAAALAGAGSLIVQPGDADRAHGVATEYGERNTVYGDLADLLAEDVDVDLAQGRVTVTVSRLNSRGNSVPTWFARFFGANEVDVAARAVAEVTPASSATCVKPLTVPDRFWDKDGDGEFDPGVDEYDPEVHGYGADWRNPGAQGDDGEGYYHDYGRTVNLKQGGPGEHQPSWWYPWDMPQIPGGPAVGGQRYRSNLGGCNPSIISVGEEYKIENGNMEDPTLDGYTMMYEQDPNAHWDEFEDIVAGSAWDPSWEGSPRIGIIPVFDPSREFDPGKNPIEFTNFIAVFFEDLQGVEKDQAIIGRILHPGGIGGGEVIAPNLKFVRLIE